MIAQVELIPYELLEEPMELHGQVDRQGGDLILEYHLCGSMLSRIPSLRSSEPHHPERSGQFRDELWKGTCFEAFVQIPKEKRYYEMNFTPEGNYAFYRFERYREEMQPNRDAPAPVIRVLSLTPNSSRVQIRARLPEPWASASELKIAMTAVLKDRDEHLSYWSIRHRIDKPDFHDPTGFVISLKPS